MTDLSPSETEAWREAIDWAFLICITVCLAWVLIVPTNQLAPVVMLGSAAAFIVFEVTINVLARL